MVSSAERNLVRIFVAVALCGALVACASVPVPEDLPAIAFRQTGLYRLEVALLVFYGGLLLVTPVISGLIRGRLPTEISTRGAKFAEEVQSDELTEAALRRLRRTVDRLADRVTAVEGEIDRQQAKGGDNR
ncbi:MAG TPA: hypothetical protein VFY69_09480 [Solirubrobacterales bacterium]|nr:hypothetical protein [Solirubrobacterales bacterium]